MYLIKSLIYWLSKKTFIYFYQKQLNEIFNIIKQTKLNVDFIARYLDGSQYEKKLFFYYMLEDFFIRDYSKNTFHLYFKNHDLFLIFKIFRTLNCNEEDLIEIYVSSKDSSYPYIEQYIKKGDLLNFNFVHYHYFFKKNLFKDIKARWLDFHSQTQKVCQFINKVNYLENEYLNEKDSQFHYTEQDLIEKYCLFLPTELSQKIFNHYLLNMYCHQAECGCDRYNRKIRDFRTYVDMCHTEQYYPFNSHDLIYRIYHHREDWINIVNDKINYIENNINAIYLYGRLGSELNDKQEIHNHIVKI